MSKLLFVCKKNHLYGYKTENKCSGLFNSASFVANYLRSENHDAQVVNANDGNDVDRLVTEFDPDFVIIEAIWLTPNKLKELLRIPRHQNRVWVIRIHSKLTFLANEGIAFSWLLGYREAANEFSNLYIAPNTEEETLDLDESFGLSTIYLPNIYQPHHVPWLPHEKEEGVINIGCFGAIRPMKNTLAQAVAAVKFADSLDLRLKFYVNAGRTEQNGDNILKNLRYFFKGQKNHTLEELGWLDYDSFIQVVRKMDIGMQVSLSETFNIVSADFVSNDIPLVASKEISWLPTMFCANPSSTKDMAEHLTFAWTQPGYILRKLSKIELNAHNLMAQDHWIDMIKDYKLDLR